MANISGVINKKKKLLVSCFACNTFRTPLLPKQETITYVKSISVTISTKIYTKRSLTFEIECINVCFVLSVPRINFDCSEIARRQPCSHSHVTFTICSGPMQYSKVRFSLQVTLFMNSPQQHPCVMNDIRMGLNGCCWVFVYVRHAKILTHCERRR